MNSEFWYGKRVFLTGHTGFKGSWLSLWLQSLGAELTGFALNPPPHSSLFEVAKVSQGMYSFFGDIRDFSMLKSTLQNASPEIVIHMAAQSLVRHSYHHPVETYETNVMGTVHLLEAIRQTKGIKSVLIVTSDKCYENHESTSSYCEEDALGGYDPYSNSKSCAELVTSAYRSSFFSSDSNEEHNVAIASARAGNVIGGGDWAKDRLIPDIVTSFLENKPVLIRNPNAVRPWQHVLEPLEGYLNLSENLYNSGAEFAEAWNFGPTNKNTYPVKWVVEKMATLWEKKVTWQIEAGDHPYETNFLNLDSTKAQSRLDWNPRWNLETALGATILWHKAHLRGEDMRAIVMEQIHDFVLSSL
jgi:CDP-glucose 4,6-dehydratase